MREGLMQPPTGQAEPVRSDTQETGMEPDPYFGGAEEASPEEQAIYEQVMDAVWGKLYANDGATDAVVNSLEGAGEDLNQIGVTAGQLGLSIMQDLDAQFKTHGSPMPESVRFEVGSAIIEEILEIAEKASMIPTDDESLRQLVTVATDEMMSKYGRGMAEQGYINPQASQALLTEMRGVAGERMGIPPQQSHPMSDGVRQANQQQAPGGMA